MTGRYRPARLIQPGWHVRLAADAGGGWMPVLARIDTVTDTGHNRIWYLGPDRLAVAGADDMIFSRSPNEIAAALHQSCPLPGQ